MLRARLSSGVFVLGLDAENVKRLLDGQPILVALAELGGKDDVLIMAGETLDKVKADLEKAIGHELPEPQDLKKLRNTQ